MAEVSRGREMRLPPLLFVVLAAGWTGAGCRATAHASPVVGTGAEAPLMDAAPDLPRDACATAEGEASCPADSGPNVRAVGVPELVSNLDESNFGAWRTFIEPGDEERAWETIDWQPSFAAGLLAADAAGRPLLVWAMNGHPLGCT